MVEDVDNHPLNFDHSRAEGNKKQESEVLAHSIGFGALKLSLHSENQWLTDSLLLESPLL